MKKFFFETWYGPVLGWCAAAGLLLGHVALAAHLQYRMARMLEQCVGGTLMILLAAATLFNIVMFVIFLWGRHWKRAIGQFVAGVIAGVGFLWALVFLLFVHMFGPSEDHFADDLTIPTNVVAHIVVPAEGIDAFPCVATSFDDDFARAVFKGLCSRKGTDDTTVTCDLSALADLVHNHRGSLIAYLARHPGWWLHEDRGRLCATRRLRCHGCWNHSLHGGYTGHTREYDHERKEDDGAYQKATHFQIRTTIGLPYLPFGRNRGADYGIETNVNAAVRIGNLGSFLSSLCFGDKDFCVDILEESTAKERRITKAALAFLKDEFGKLKLPDDASTHGPDEFILRNGSQPGIYNLTLRINPGEPGITYLKALEVTKGTRLSEDRLYNASNERVGWSSDLNEKFLYENEFTIYEGDWGKPYAARIEVWFRPDSGKSERKLAERICKIEGWQR